MADQQGWTKRFETYRTSKTQTFWACAACVAVVLIVGFSWGGWVTGANARETRTEAVSNARAQVAAAFCVHRFTSAPNAGAQLAALKSAEYWKRSDLIAKGGWVTVPGHDKAVKGAADLCAQQLMEAKAPATTAATAAQTAG